MGVRVTSHWLFRSVAGSDGRDLSRISRIVRSWVVKDEKWKSDSAKCREWFKGSISHSNHVAM